MSNLPTISEGICSALDCTGNGVDACYGRARRIAMNLLIQISRIEGRMGGACPASVSNTRSAIETALLLPHMGYEAQFEGLLDTAWRDAEQCPVLRTAPLRGGL